MSKENKQEVSLSNPKQTTAEKSRFSDLKDSIPPQQLPSVTANTLNNAQIGDHATVEVHTHIHGMQVNIGENAAEQKAAFEKRVQELLKQIADRLKQYYSTKGTITTLIQRHQLPISEINLSIDHEPKPYQSAAAEDQKVNGQGRPLQQDGRKDEEKLRNAAQLIPAAKIFDPKILRPEEKERKGMDLAAEDKPVKHLLVLGVAGTGKTTMSQFFAHQWATKELWHEKFDYLFWLPLRNLIGISRREKLSLAAVLYRECLKPTAKDLKEEECAIEALQLLFKTQQSRILVVLDGYDEVGHLMSDNAHPVTIIVQEALSIEYFIVTSRPYHLYNMVSFDRRLENTGFTDNNIQQYIRQYFLHSVAKEAKLKGTQENDSGQKLQNFLQANSALWEMAHVPINLTLVCDVWQQLQEADLSTAQMTTTQLYQIILNYLLRTYLQKKGGILDGYFCNVTSKELEMHCLVELAFLETLAFEAMLQGYINLTAHMQQNIVEQITHEHAKDIRKYFAHRSVFQSALEVGLLRTVQASESREIQREHCFLHLTFQEFLAARYLRESLLLPRSERYQTAIQFISDEKYNPRYQVLFGFLAGLVGQSKKLCLIFWNTVLAPPRDLTSFAHWRLVIRCLEESHCEPSIPYRDAILHSFVDWINKLLKVEKMESLEDWLIGRLQLQRYPVFCKNFFVVEALLKALSDGNATVRKGAAKVLGELGEKIATEAVVQALLRSLNDNENEVKENAAEALGNMGEKAATEAVVEALLKMHSDNAGRGGLPALWALGKLGVKETVVDNLLKALRDGSEKVRKSVAQALGSLGKKGATKRVVDGLLKALEDKDGGVRHEATEAFRSLRDITATEPVVERLLQMLNHIDGQMRGNAVAVLGCLVEKWTTEPVVAALLKALLDDDNGYVRHRALYTLRELGMKGARGPVVEGLSKALSHNDPWVRQFTAQFLIELIDKDAIGLVINELLKDGLLKQLSDSDSYVRSNAAAGLVALGKKGAVKPVVEGLLKVLKESKSDGKLSAIVALEDLEEQGASEQVIEELLKALSDGDKWVARKAAEALGNLAKNEPRECIIKALLQKLNSSHEKVRESTVIALGNLAEKLKPEFFMQVLNALLGKRNDRDEDVRKGVINALGKLAEKGLAIEPALEALLAALRDNKRVKQSAICALGNLGKSAATRPVIVRLLEALSDNDTETSRYAADALGQLGKTGMRGLIVQELFRRLKRKEFNNTCRKNIIDKLRVLCNEEATTRFNAEWLLSSSLKAMSLEPGNVSIKDFLDTTPFALSTLMEVYSKESHALLPRLIALHAIKQDVPFMLIERNPQHSPDRWACFYENGKRYGYVITVAQQNELSKAFAETLENFGLSLVAVQVNLSDKPIFPLISDSAPERKRGTTAADIIGAGKFKTKKDPAMFALAKIICERMKLKLEGDPDWSGQKANQDKILSSVKDKLVFIMVSGEGVALFSQLKEEDFNINLADAIAEEIAKEIADIASIEVESYHIKDGIKAYSGKMQNIKKHPQVVYQF